MLYVGCLKRPFTGPMHGVQAGIRVVFFGVLLSGERCQALVTRKKGRTGQPPTARAR